MNFNLNLTSEEFAVLWAALGEFPAKHSFAVMEKLKAQVQEQENAHQRRSTESGDVYCAPSGSVPVG